MSTLPIKIDLRDLTPTHLEQCLPHIAACNYQAPCVIGTLLTPEQRLTMDKADPIQSDNVANLVAKGFMEFPEGQLELATSLQDFFDTDVEPEDFAVMFDRIVRKAKELPSQ